MMWLTEVGIFKFSKDRGINMVDGMEVGIEIGCEVFVWRLICGADCETNMLEFSAFEFSVQEFSVLEL